MSKWQDISTAPRDGTWFWAFYPKDGSPDCFQDQWKVAHWVADWFHEGYPGFLDAAEHEEFDQPTHWMALSSPQAQGESEEERSDDEATTEHSEVSLTQKIEQLEASLALCERRLDEAESRNVFLLTELERILKEAK